MDIADWKIRLLDAEWKEWDVYFQKAKTIDKGRRISWALNLLAKFCEIAGCPAHPENLPNDSQLLRGAFDSCMPTASRQMLTMGIKTLRTLICADERCSNLLALLPRFRRKEPINVIARHTHVVVDDSLPKGCTAWMKELLKDIMEHPASQKWRTSRCANQNLHLIHRFIRCTRLNDSQSKEHFISKIEEMSEAEVRSICEEFSDKFCSTTASARRYLGVFNHLFYRLWCKVPRQINMPAKKRKLYSLEELDARLSQSTRSSATGKMGESQDYFDETELSSIRMAAASGPLEHRLRDTLIVGILETTGLRRMGLLNIQLNNIAEYCEETETWVAMSFGRTLTKGKIFHRFQVYPILKRQLEEYLNSPETQGGRPCGPSPFLFPSSNIDQGQMSASTLNRIFKEICARAGFQNDKRCHLHAMRHSCAHELYEKGNSSRQISLVLGHRSQQITEKVYLRDTVERGCANMKLPTEWLDTPDPVPQTQPSAQSVPVIAPPAIQCDTSTRKRKSTRELAAQALELLEKTINKSTD